MPFCYDDTHQSLVCQEILTGEKLNKNLSKKWTFLWFWTWKNTTLLGKVQLLLNHWLYPFIIHAKQQQCIEVQFRIENTYVQLRVWLQRKNKNDWIVLRERRKCFKKLWGLFLYIPHLDSANVISGWGMAQRAIYLMLMNCDCQPIFLLPTNLCPKIFVWSYSHFELAS